MNGLPPVGASATKAYSKNADAPVSPYQSASELFESEWRVQLENDVKSFDEYKKEAKQGDKYAQAVVGHCYLNAIGIEKDERKGYKYLNRSADEPANNAAMLLLAGIVYDSSRGESCKAVRENELEIAISWYQQVTDEKYTEFAKNMINILSDEIASSLHR